jgi:hypothetical protein
MLEIKGSYQPITNCSCANGFFGEKCTKFNCFGEEYNSSDTCSFGNGYCFAPDFCFCKTNFTGQKCEIYPCDISNKNKCAESEFCRNYNFNKFEETPITG